MVQLFKALYSTSGLVGPWYHAIRSQLAAFQQFPHIRAVPM